jgi:hypothetical protein
MRADRDRAIETVDRTGRSRSEVNLARVGPCRGRRMGLATARSYQLRAGVLNWAVMPSRQRTTSAGRRCLAKAIGMRYASSSTAISSYGPGGDVRRLRRLEPGVAQSHGRRKAGCGSDRRFTGKRSASARAFNVGDGVAVGLSTSTKGAMRASRMRVLSHRTTARSRRAAGLRTLPRDGGADTDARPYAHLPRPLRPERASTSTTVEG